MKTILSPAVREDFRPLTRIPDYEHMFSIECMLLSFRIVRREFNWIAAASCCRAFIDEGTPWRNYVSLVSSPGGLSDWSIGGSWNMDLYLRCRILYEWDEDH